MMSIKQASLNQPIADLPFVTNQQTSGHFSQLLGKHLILYFYPKDSTPGCTQESKNFRDLFQQFQTLNTNIIGISRDSLKSHDKFICKYELPFELISDADEALCQYFDVLKEKSFLGKKYIGIERSTFLIDAQGILRQEWRNVKVSGHVEEVLQAVKLLRSVYNSRCLK
jgi:thioredoxin-dependent peroxiredoxin